MVSSPARQPAAATMAPESAEVEARPPPPPLFHRLFAVFCGVGSLRARYTIAKLRDFDQYVRTTSAWRHVAVIILTPLPSLATSLLPVLIPLQDPDQGVDRNTGYMLHFFTTLGFISLGSVFQIRAPCGISHRDISNAESFCIAVVSSLLITATATLLGFVWRFPVPFIWVTAYVPFVCCLVFAHNVVLREKLWRDRSIRDPLLAFLPSYFMQGFQVVIYPAFSAVFEMSDELGQVALTLFFPFIKYGFRQILRKLTSHLTEDADEVAVSGVEICATMYQSMIMQNTPSPITTALVIGLDVVQGLFANHVFMDKHSVVPLEEIVSKACDIVRPLARTWPDNELSVYGTIKRVPRLVSLPLRKCTRRHHRVAPEARARSINVKAKSADVTGHNEKQITTHALEIAQSAESILIIECFEVSVPIVNALFLAIASQRETAIYNPKIQPYYHDQSLLGPAISSLALYTLLQGLSVVMMHVVMWRRYRVSATKLLAYVLERHAWSLQGKLITWLSAIFQLPVVHYGEFPTIRCSCTHTSYATNQIRVLWTQASISSSNSTSPSTTAVNDAQSSASKTRRLWPNNYSPPDQMVKTFALHDQKPPPNRTVAAMSTGNN